MPQCDGWPGHLATDEACKRERIDKSYDVVYGKILLICEAAAQANEARNVARVLTSAPLADGMISHKDSGQLICEAEALLQQVKAVLGGLQYQEFREDIRDLLDVQGGAEKQLRVVERMRWAYFN